MLLNTDGTPYRSFGTQNQIKLTQFDLFNSWDQEAIEKSGGIIQLFSLILSQNDIDPLYLESRSKLFSPIGIELSCFYEPIPSQNYINAFGIDAPDEMIFEFNYKYILEKVGFPPKIGSRIYSPHLKENWVIIQRNLGEFKMWGAMRLQLICQKFQESVSTLEGNVIGKSNASIPGIPGIKIV
jgi:hypothetical protein